MALVVIKILIVIKIQIVIISLMVKGCLQRGEWTRPGYERCHRCHRCQGYWCLIWLDANKVRN